MIQEVSQITLISTLLVQLLTRPSLIPGLLNHRRARLRSRSLPHLHISRALLSAN